MRKVTHHWGLVGLNIILFLLFTTVAMAQDHSGHTAGAKAKASPSSGKQQPEIQKNEEAPKVEISTEQQKLIGVKTVIVTMRPLQKVIRTVGRLEADESRLATVNAKIEGWIEKLYVPVTGSYVKKGDPPAFGVFQYFAAMKTKRAAIRITMLKIVPRSIRTKPCSALTSMTIRLIIR